MAAEGPILHAFGHFERLKRFAREWLRLLSG
jgi:hypothetical protein